jgi:hypothetical protein
VYKKYTFSSAVVYLRHDGFWHDSSAKSTHNLFRVGGVSLRATLCADVPCETL